MVLVIYKEKSTEKHIQVKAKTFTIEGYNYLFRDFSKNDEINLNSIAICVDA